MLYWNCHMNDEIVVKFVYNLSVCHLFKIPWDRKKKSSLWPKISVGNSLRFQISDIRWMSVLKVRLFVEFLCKLGFFGTSEPTSAKKAQLTHERVEYKVFFVRRAPERLQIA
jgi:hypothetical protein